MSIATPFDNPEDQITGKAYDARLMRRLWRYLRPRRRLLLIALVCVLVMTAGDIAGPYLIKLGIDNHIAPHRLQGLEALAALYLGVLAVAFAARYTQYYLMNVVGQGVMYDLRLELFAHLQRMSLGFFDRRPVGVLVTRMTNDIDALNDLLTTGAVAIAGDLITLAGIVVVLLLVDWRLALVTFAVVPLVALAANLFRQRMRDSYRAIRTRLGRINGYLQEAISGMLITQLFSRERRSFERFDQLNADYRNANLYALFVFAVFLPTVMTLGVLATALLLWFGGGRIVQGALTLGTLFLFIQLTDRFFQPIRDLAEKYNILQAAMASAERIFRLLDEPEGEAPSGPTAVALPRLRGAIEFRNVWFAYHPGEWILKDVSFRVAPGQKVAFVGATGAGKTSLISVLTRFYEIQKGQILLDGIDIATVDRSDLRRHIGVVLQDPFIFSRSVRDNIRLGSEDISLEQVQRAARTVNADAFIRQLPHGYDQELHERGSDLSTGQKQLLTFARAVASNPDIMIVLDEATSNVDTETEHLIQQSLAKLTEGRTSILIAHRLSTIRQVDGIFVLHRGHLVETGTHQELLARNGIYARLYELQYAEQAAG
jgi:ATP-binding cassette subfamily B protein